MSKFDKAVDDFIIARFIGDKGETAVLEGNTAGFYAYDYDGGPSEITVVKADMGWDCDCWSSWTRDDTFEIKALIKTKSREVEFTYSTWGGFPDLITELDEYINNESCHYESDEYKS